LASSAKISSETIYQRMFGLICQNKFKYSNPATIGSTRRPPKKCAVASSNCKTGEKKTRGRPPKKCAIASSNSDATKRKKCKKPSCTVKHTLASSKPDEKKKPGKPRKHRAVASARRGNGSLCKCVSIRLKQGAVGRWKNWEGKKVWTVSARDVDYITFKHWPIELLSHGQRLCCHVKKDVRRR
jgi:hypothetical protein